MRPDISRKMSAHTGMRVTLACVRLADTAHGNGKDWDVFARAGKSLGSFAVRGTKKQLLKLLETAQNRDVLVTGVFGPEERDLSGEEVFRRIFCSVDDFKVFDSAR